MDILIISTLKSLVVCYESLLYIHVHKDIKNKQNGYV